MYQALYRKWRPAVFDDVYGQSHITTILKSEVENGKISHAYLFCGPRGTGKTTCAKIIAKAANCENPVNGNPCCKCPSCLAIDNGTTADVIEMDAASNNGVDDIRDLRDGVVYTPADLKFRVYIIDEVHMLSTQAFNALLKTLEEPPAHVIFILATTELHKIPATILSRCQRFDFRRVTPASLIERMKIVCRGEKINAEDEALDLIARLSQGSFRDALNMLEFCSGESKDITAVSAGELLGASSAEMLSSFATAIASNDVAAALDLLNEVYLSSRDITVFWRELISFLRDVLVCAVTKGKKTTGEKCTAAAGQFAPSKLVSVIEQFTSAEADMTRMPTSAKLYAEIALIKATEIAVKNDTQSLGDRVSTLEQQIKKMTTMGFAPIQQESGVPVVKKQVEEKVKEAVKPEKPAVTPAPQVSEYTAVKKWQDVIRSVAAKDPSLRRLLYDAYAKKGKDGKLYLIFTDKTMFKTIEVLGVKDTIAIEYNAITGEHIDPESIEYVLNEAGAEELRRPIDELIEKSEEQ